jgi:NAD(P)-dependent dehydrogenase (short-subunit alcohol dehydrogenase family)
MILDFSGRVAIVTGGATGIGRAVATRLASSGASVVIASRNRERGERAAAALTGAGHDVRFVRVDVRREAEVKLLMEAMATAFGAIDYVFNNAGIEAVRGPMDSTTDQMVDEMVGTNFKGVFMCMKHAAPRMTAGRGGVIVNTASFAGTVVPFPDAIVYGATKAAVLSMTRAAAAGLSNVRVYAVCPWITDTPMIDRLTGFETCAKMQCGALNPGGRVVAPDDVARVVMAMFSGTAGLDTGEAVLVDSGGSMQRVRPVSVWDAVPVMSS